MSTSREQAEDFIEAAGARLSARRAAVRRLIGVAPSERRAQTQALLLAAGRELIADKGIGGTSVGDICSRAGFTRGAFYSNFTDMDHFVQRLAEEQWDSIIAFVDGSVAGAMPGDPDRPAPETDAELTAGLAELASRLLGAMPISREVFLLQHEFAAYIARTEDANAGASPLRESYAAFKQHLVGVLVEGLASIGRECLLSPEDTTELILATAVRSMRMALDAAAANGDLDTVDVAGAGAADSSDLTAFLGRTLPTLLARLSTPVPQPRGLDE
ncbi:DNA-binding transcriptional regulator, AcrR family [Actinomyces ruminicola]|uniref:DNA-binding transcriptional regulator, AcrR family n=1 Tax=Actinomyces ruminicola TaxID=332524 RepID=A0A1H0E1A8_9ACTO|nr:TetR/AcrR family transcriptional regulator [Actinomyces ruminicola]SDN76149.1 DNA-binding transcriptional regulator, AcrR family [Actinomyces ruminicola]